MKNMQHQRTRLLSLLLSLLMILSLVPAAALAQTPDPVTIRFESCGAEGTMPDVTISAGQDYTLPECGFTAPEGLVFSGWDYNDGQQVWPAGDPGQKICPTQDVQLQPYWAYSNERFPIDTLGLTLCQPQAGDSLVMPEGTPAKFQVTKAWQCNALLGSPRWLRYEPADGSTSTPEAVQPGDLLLLSIPFRPLESLYCLQQVKLRAEGLGDAVLTCHDNTAAMPEKAGQWCIREDPQQGMYWLHILLQEGTLHPGTPMDANTSIICFNPEGGSGYMRPVACRPGTSFCMPECTYRPPQGKVFDCWYFGTRLKPGQRMTIGRTGGKLNISALWKDAPHVHDFSGEWVSNETQHWHECSCGAKQDVAGHTLEWVVDREPTETRPGSRHQQCTVCGYQLPAEEIPAVKIYTVLIRYNSNGGIGSIASSKVTDITPEITFTLSGAKPTRRGMTFEGWSTEKNGAPMYQPGEEITLPAGEYTFYAVWSAAPAATRYTLDYQAGLFSPRDTVVESMENEAELTVTKQVPFHFGKAAFLGWSTRKNGSVEYRAGDQVKLSKDAPVLQLYPVWETPEKMTSYRLDYQAGFFAPRDTVVKSTADYAVLFVTDKVPFKFGQGTFLGWSTQKNGSAEYQAGDEITLYKDHPTLKLYAVWGK